MSNRLTGLNVALLFLAAAASLFGLYGMFIHHGQESRPANRVAVDDLDGTGSEEFDPIEGKEREKKDRPDGRQPKSTPGKSTTPPAGAIDDPVLQPDLRNPDDIVASNPTDFGDATIEGTVIDSANAPVSGATVTARRSNLELTAPTLEDNDFGRYSEAVEKLFATAARETRTTVTGDDGTFKFTGLDGTLAYDLSARTDSALGEQSRVAAGDKIVILLSPQSALIGRVETKDGKPVTSFTVRAWRQNRQWEQTSRGFDDPEGRFSMPAKAGTMQVEIDAPGYTQAKPQDVEVGKDTVIVLERGAILSGVVTDKEGNPLADVVVSEGEGEENWRRGWYQDNDGSDARTDSKGRYRLDTLNVGEVKITAALGEMSETQSITLVQGDNTLDFQLDVGGILRLRLSDPEGKPLEAEQVWFQTKGDRGWPRPERMPAREPGLAEYAGLKPGEYTMTVTASSYPAITQDITVSAGNNEFSLKFSKGAMLSGVVSSNNGGKVSNVGVRLRKEEEDRWGGWGTGRYAQVNEDGTYKLGPAEPGQWRVEVYATSTWTEIYNGTVTIAEGENTHNISVDAGATLTIKLVDESGNSVAWGNVNLTGDKTYYGQSGDNGIATISFVQVGSYTMVASAQGMASPSQFISLSSGDNQLTVKLQKPNCCRVTHVYPDTQAQKIGLQVGDLIIEYNNQAISGWGGFGQAVRATDASAEITMSVERGGVVMSFTLKGGTVGIEGADGVR